MSANQNGWDLGAVKRWREPAAWIALVALALHLPFAVVSLIVYRGSDVFGSIEVAGGYLAPGTSNVALVIALTGLVCLCVLVEPTPRARAVTTAAAIVIVLTTLLALTYGIFGFLSPSPTRVLGLLDLLVTLVVPVLAAVTLFRLLQAQTAGARAGVPSAPAIAPGSGHLVLGDPSAPGSGASGAAAAHPAGPPGSPAADLARQPTWQPEAAAGYAWPTAGQAAAGAPAAGWGSASPAAGWQPADAWTPGGATWTPPGYVDPSQPSARPDHERPGDQPSQRLDPGWPQGAGQPPAWGAPDRSVGPAQPPRSEEGRTPPPGQAPAWGAPDGLGGPTQPAAWGAPGRSDAGDASALESETATQLVRPPQSEPGPGR